MAQSYDLSDLGAQQIHDLSDLGGQKLGMQAPQSTLDQIANSAPVNGVLGFGDALHSMLTAGLHNPQSASGTAYDVGKFGGNIAGFLGGGELLDAARVGMQGAPLIGKLAESLGGSGVNGVARRAIGSAGYGALTNANNREEGAAAGGALSAALDSIPYIGKGISAASSAIKPQKFANGLLQDLSGGKSLSENAQSLAQDLKAAYEKRVSEGSALYKPIFDQLGTKSIYEATAPANSAYSTAAKDTVGGYDRNLTKLHQQFSEDPTLLNAHNLQSQLGTSIRKLQAADGKGTLSIADRSSMQGYQDAQNALRQDMSNFLENQSPGLSNQYQNATKNWAENVTPYTENPRIAPIAKGEIESPKNLTTLFKNPEGNIQKIVEDMGDGANSKILFGELGKRVPSSSAEGLERAIKSLPDKGLDSYVTPDLSKQFETLSSRISNRNMAQRGAGALVGIGAIHPIAGHIPLDLLGAFGAGALSPPVMRAIQNKVPMDKFGEGLLGLLKGSYGIGKPAALSNALPNSY